MRHLFSATERRQSLDLLSETDLVLSERVAEDVDVLFGETIDLLPLSTLIALTERARAA